MPCFPQQGSRPTKWRWRLLIASLMDECSIPSTCMALEEGHLRQPEQHSVPGELNWTVPGGVYGVSTSVNLARARQ